MRRVQVHPVHWSMSQDSELAAWRSLDAHFLSYDPNYSRITSQIMPTERLELILSHNSLFVRAQDLSLFLQRCPADALKDNYQLLVDTIFANRDRDQSWDLRCLRRVDYPQESGAILRLLAPDGPLLTLALRLMDDHSFLLEFPLDGLPSQLRKKLLEMDVPTFFSNKLGVLSSFGMQQNVVQNLLLNPFEYFFFSFASINLLGLSTGRSVDYLNGWAALQDTLYTNVLEEYLVYYFPCNGAGVPNHNFNYGAQNEAVFMSNSLLRQQQTKSKVGLSTLQEHHQLSEANLPKLFKSSVLQEQSGASARENLFLSTHPSAYKEVWRSETMLHVFMELWMCGYHEGLDKMDFLSSSSPMMFGGLPSVEVVKSIRMVVRHLHYFINCVNTHAMHPMDEIKRTTFPMFQRRLYAFLRYLFHHWPLDNSFRIVYETWLSYLQPWRYTVLDRTKGNQIREQIDVPIDRRWFTFILDNILFYSKIFSQMIGRLERVDLTATKNALMFYRLAKVFTSQDTLKSMLKEIEQGIRAYEEHSSGTTMPVSNVSNQRTSGGILKSPRPTYSTPGAARATTTIGGYFGKMSPIVASPGSPSAASPTSPCFSPDSVSNLAKFSHIKQLMRDFEAAHSVYQPIFSASNVSKIRYLINASAEARDYLCETSNKLLGKEMSTSCAITNFFQNLWTEASAENQIATMNATEKTKAANQLEYARSQFAVFFDIPLPENSNPLLQPTSPSSAQSYGSLFSTDASPYSNGLYKSSSFSPGQSQKAMLPQDVLVDGDMLPFGNPDTGLIRSDEIRLLVRLLCYISAFLNHVFGDRIEATYFTDSWGGRYLRAMLAEPTEYVTSSKVACRGSYNNLKKSVKVTQYLPPRVNLRFLGSHICWAWIFIAVVFAMILNLKVAGSLLTYSFLYFIYLTFRATSEPVNKREELFQLKMLYHNSNPRRTEEVKMVQQRSTSAPAHNKSYTDMGCEDDLFIRRRNVRSDGDTCF